MNDLILSSITKIEFNEMIESAMNKLLQNADKNYSNNDLSELLTQKQAGELLKVSAVTLIDWRKKGLIECHKINKRVYYRRGELMTAVTTNLHR